MKRHQHPIVANTGIIAAEIVEDLQAALAQFAEWSRWEASDIDGLSREAEKSGRE